MARYNGFVGASYVGLSKTLAAERCVNLFPEVLQNAVPKNQMVLIGTPGDSLFVDLGTGPVRGVYEQDGRAWAVGGGSLFEVFPNGTATNRGWVGLATGPVSMVANGQKGHQLLVISNGAGFILDLNTAELTQTGVPAFPAGASQADFVDGYFVILVPGTSVFALSALYNGLLWNTLDRGQVSTSAANLVGLIVYHREIWMMGSTGMEAWVDSGTLTFPFAPLRGTVMDVGLLAPWSVVKLRDELALCWLGKTDGGPRVFAAKGGYTPTAISTHAVDLAIQGYGEDAQRQARAYSYQEHGHNFYVLTFPPPVTVAWVYDYSDSQLAGMPLWHERSRWNGAQGLEEPPTSWCHVYAFGRHLIGSRDDGKIYSQSLTTYTEHGNTIRRTRRAPYLSREHGLQFHSRFEIDGEMGVGIAGTGPGSDPQITLRSSDDRWTTSFSHGPASLGKQGDVLRRLEWFALGSTRERGYELEIAEPVPVRLTDAYLDVGVGTF